MGGSYESLVGQQQFGFARRPPMNLPGTSSSGSSISLFNASRRVEQTRGAVDASVLTRRLDNLAAMRNAERLQRTATPHLPADQEVRFRGAAFNADTEGVTLTRGSMPRAEFLRYANRGGMEYPNVMRAAWRAIRKHKRKLLIGGIAIAATAGILGGGIYGGQYNQSIIDKLKLEAKLGKEPHTILKEIKAEIKAKEAIKPKVSFEDMQYAKPVGVFEKMSNEAASGGNYGGGGGGSSGGGGFGNYQKALQAAGHSTRKTQGKRGRRRRRFNKKASKTSSHKTRRGKVTKRRRTRKRINKRGKTSKRHSSKKAF
jgi:uncharacterized membrane protein YgcG